MEKLDQYSSDSTWNFHEWTEAWFARSDIPSGYSGWQIIDATPQETSEGIFQTGPASQIGVKRGDVNFNYDMHFVFSEVAAVAVHWMEDRNSPLGWKKVRNDAYESGAKIVTKAIGRFDENGISDGEDVTYDYKYEDKKEFEGAIQNAARRAGVEVLFSKGSESIHDVLCEMLPIEPTMIGNSFKVVLKVTNKIDKQLNIMAILRIGSNYYNGMPGNLIKKEKKEFLLQPKSAITFEVDITANDYLSKLVEHSLIKVYGRVDVEESGEIWSHESDFTISKPQLQLAVNGPAVVGKPIKLTVKFTNPLSTTLTNCQFTSEGFVRYTKFPFRDIQPHESIEATLEIIADKINYGHKVILFRSANFKCEKNGRWKQQ
jgi:transglutaminase 1